METLKMSAHDWYVLKSALVLALIVTVLPLLFMLQMPIISRLMRWNRVFDRYRDYPSSFGKTEQCRCVAWGDIPVPCGADVSVNERGLHIAVWVGRGRFRSIRGIWPVTIPWQKIRVVGFNARTVRLAFEGVEGFSLSIPLYALQSAIGDNRDGKQLLQRVLDHPVVNASQHGG
jgi:hypothetical protein